MFGSPRQCETIIKGELLASVLGYKVFVNKLEIEYKTVPLLFKLAVGNANNINRLTKLGATMEPAEEYIMITCLENWTRYNASGVARARTMGIR